MKQTLYIRLSPTADGTVSWCLHDPAAGYAPVRSGMLEQVLADAAGRRVIVLVSATEVMLLSVELPPQLASGSSARIQQALPYLLEDRLAEDVETLHFALGPRQPDGQFPVAVVSQEHMQAWLEPFRQKGLMPECLVVETHCLPLPRTAQPVWSVLQEGTRSIVRTGLYAGFACETETLGDYLLLAERPAELQLQLYPAGPAAGLDPLAGTDLPLQRMAPVADALEYLLRGFDPAQAINLLQGVYAGRSDYQKLLRPWRAALILLGVWVLLATLGQALEYRRLRQDLAAAEQAAATSFRAAFPQIGKVVDLRGQAQQQLAILQRGGGQAGFLQLLQGTSATLQKIPGLQLQELQYREGALQLSLTAADVQALDVLQQGFASEPALSLEVQSANAGSEGMQIRARVKARRS